MLVPDVLLLQGESPWQRRIATNGRIPAIKEREIKDTRLHVLLVEDDEDDYILIRDLLGEIEGFELRWTRGYTEALQGLEGGEHDVCLLDYRLGERSGLELLQEARSRGYAIPMILLTGQGDRQIDLRAMEAGAADYLLKGELDAPTLERSVRYAFARALRAISESERRFRF